MRMTFGYVNFTEGLRVSLKKESYQKKKYFRPSQETLNIPNLKSRYSVKVINTQKFLCKTGRTLRLELNS